MLKNRWTKCFSFLSLFTRTVCWLWCHCAAHHFLNGNAKSVRKTRDGELQQREKYFCRILQLIRNDYTWNPWNRSGSNKFSQKDFFLFPNFSISIVAILFHAYPQNTWILLFCIQADLCAHNFCLMYPSILASSIQCDFVCCCIQTVETNKCGMLRYIFLPSFFSFHCDKDKKFTSRKFQFFAK